MAGTGHSARGRSFALFGAARVRHRHRHRHVYWRHDTDTGTDTDISADISTDISIDDSTNAVTTFVSLNNLRRRQHFAASSSRTCEHQLFSSHHGIAEAADAGQQVAR